VEKTAYDFAEGDSEFFYHTVTREEIEGFAILSGDSNPLHINREFAEQSGSRDIVSHGMLTSALVSRLIGTKLPGYGSLWLSQDFEFTSAVFPGDLLKVFGKVIRVLTRGELVEIEFEVSNQDGKTVLRGSGRVKLPEIKSRSESQDTDLPSTVKSMTALVIGASGSLGGEILSSLASNGVRTLGTFKTNPNKLEDRISILTSNGGVCRAIKLDVGKPKEINQVVTFFKDNWGAPDIIINCSSLPPSGLKLEDTETESIMNHIESEISGYLAFFRIFRNSMVEKRFGRIISIGTSATNGKAESGWSGYLAAKSASEQVIKSIASEYAVFGITANTISPGLSQTGMSATFAKQAVIAAKAETPSRQLVTHSEVAAFVSYLATNASNAVNGQVITLDGGRTMH
jgi:NAD(P)-dependent dehydrogenase (short-subunit alcohol dehydrogenase family)/acyl dehydratase